MPDSNLEEIWCVREELIKKHGGFDGYFPYIQKLDQARLRGEQEKKGKKASRRPAGRTRAGR
jgi:hypothetical protein